MKQKQRRRLPHLRLFLWLPPSTVTSPNGKTRSLTLNPTGWLASATDEAGTAVTFTYNSLGKPLTTTVAGDVTNITYDDRGFRQSLQDVNMPNPIQYVYYTKSSKNIFRVLHYGKQEFVHRCNILHDFCIYTKTKRSF